MKIRIKQVMAGEEAGGGSLLIVLWIVNYFGSNAGLIIHWVSLPTPPRSLMAQQSGEKTLFHKHNVTLYHRTLFLVCERKNVCVWMLLCSNACVSCLSSMWQWIPHLHLTCGRMREQVDKVSWLLTQHQDLSSMLPVHMLPSAQLFKHQWSLALIN